MREPVLAPVVEAELSPAERSRLVELEAVVEEGMAVFVCVGQALLIARGRLASGD